MSDLEYAVKADQTAIDTLGPCRIENPITKVRGEKEAFACYIEDIQRVRLNPYMGMEPLEGAEPASFEQAGPRCNIYFDPKKLKAAIVTCGGMCPGINSLVRAIVLQLHYIYGVNNVFGIRFGLQGFIPDFGHELIELTPERVRNMHGPGRLLSGHEPGPPAHRPGGGRPGAAQRTAFVHDRRRRHPKGLPIHLPGDREPQA